jgi:hypothetical protein
MVSSPHLAWFMHFRVRCGGEPTLLQSVQGRFLLHVFPGETLVTEIWQNKKESVYVQSSILTSIIVEYCLFCVFEFINVDYILCSTFHFFDKITWVLFHKLKFYDCFTWSIALLGVSFRQFDFVLQSLCIRATFKVKVKERGKVVLSGTVRLHPRGSRLWTFSPVALELTKCSWHLGTLIFQRDLTRNLRSFIRRKYMRRYPCTWGWK